MKINKALTSGTLSKKNSKMKKMEDLVTGEKQKLKKIKIMISEILEISEMKNLEIKITHFRISKLLKKKVYKTNNNNGATILMIFDFLK